MQMQHLYSFHYFVTNQYALLASFTQQINKLHMDTYFTNLDKLQYSYSFGHTMSGVFFNLPNFFNKLIWSEIQMAEQGRNAWLL